MKKHHPEQMEDEIFLGNAHSVHALPDLSRRYRGDGWRTQRMGKVAYRADGAVYTGKDLLPSFVKRQEIEAARAAAETRGDKDTAANFQRLLDTGSIWGDRENQENQEDQKPIS